MIMIMIRIIMIEGDTDLVYSSTPNVGGSGKVKHVCFVVGRIGIDNMGSRVK